MMEHQVQEILLSHGVPAAVLDVWSNSRSPLSLIWSKPDFTIAEALEHHIPGLRGLCPIFQQNGEAVIGLLTESGRFIRFYYEDGQQGDAAIELMGLNYQQFASAILLELLEAGMGDLFDELVSILQFKRGPELRALLNADAYSKAAIEDFHSQLASEV